MVAVRVCSEIKKSLKSVVSTIKVGKNSRYIVSVFNKKNSIPFVFVGYEMVILNSTLCTSLALSISISYPTRTGGIIVNYSY